MRPALLLTLLLALAGPAAASGEPPLEVGFGRRSLVTERRGVTLGGYGGRGLIPALGVHDPCFAKAMVLRTPERTAAIVALDLVGVQRGLLEALAARPFPPEARLDPAAILICASHTHSSYGSLARPTGALYLDALFFATCGLFRRDFFDETVANVRGAIEDAIADLRPARLGVGSARVEGLARNRGRAGGPVDPEIGVVKVEALDGAVRGVLVNFAGHPVLVGAEHLEISADFPGAMQRALEARWPGATALFTQGAAGDLTARAPRGEWPDDWAKVEATGRRLAGHVTEIAERIETRPALALDARTAEIAMPRPQALEHRLRRLAGGLDRTLFTQIALGDALLMGVPGEPCCAIGLDMKAAARQNGFQAPFVVGLAQDHLGYFVHKDDYAPERSASHDYEKSLNFYGPEVGRFLVEVHAERLGLRPIGGNRAEPRARAGPF